MTAYGGGAVNLQLFLTLALDGKKQYLHTPTALLLGKETPVPTKHEASAPQSWSVFFGKKGKSLAPAGNWASSQEPSDYTEIS